MERSDERALDQSLDSVVSRRSHPQNFPRTPTRVADPSQTKTSQRSTSITRVLHVLFWITLVSAVGWGIYFVSKHHSNNPVAAFVENMLNRTPATSLAQSQDDTKTFVIVGGGLAGMSATLTLVTEAQKQLAANLDTFPKHMRVVLVDKQSTLGGNSAKASSGMNGVNSDSQRRWEAENKVSEPDTIEYFLADTLRSCVSTDEGVVGAGHTTEPDAAGKAGKEHKTSVASDRMRGLVEVLVNDSASSIKFLETLGGLGTDPGLSRIVQLGGHSKPRTHRPGVNHPLEKMPIGVALTTSISKELRKLEQQLSQPTADGQAPRLTLNIRTGVTLTGIRTSSTQPRKVTGVTLSETCNGGACGAHEVLDCTAVLIATGGFGANSNLVAAYAPALAHLNLPTTNGAWTTGEAVQMAARDCGAVLVDMSEVQVHPTSFLDPAAPLDRTRFLAPEALRGSGGLLFDDAGKRFVNELATRDYVSRHIQSLPSPTFEIPTESKYPSSAFLLLSHDAATTFGLPALGFYKFKGFVTIITAGDAKGAGSIARATAIAMQAMRAKGSAKAAVENIDAMISNLENALRSYVSSATSGSPDAFGKSVFPHALSYAALTSASTLDTVTDDATPLAYLMLVAPAVHYTMGGIAIDDKGRALGWPSSSSAATEDKISTTGAVKSYSTFETPELAQLEVIPGLFAAGEASGGLHGKNRLGGNSLLECVVFGRRAGQTMFQDSL